VGWARKPWTHVPAATGQGRSAPHRSAPQTFTATRATMPSRILAAEAPLDQPNLPRVLPTRTRTLTAGRLARPVGHHQQQLATDRDRSGRSFRFRRPPSRRQ
jgi:hypothetical protein